MNTLSRINSRRILFTGIMVATTLLTGCRSWREARAERRASRAANSAAGVVTLDGKFNDWPSDVSTMADSNWVYFRVSVEGQDKPLQSADSTLALWLDADDNPATGAQMPSPKVASAIGVDLIVEFSPQDASGHATPGVAAFAVASTGAKTALTQPQLPMAAAPTVAASSYEVRVSRYPHPTAAPALAKMLSAPGQARGMFVLIENGKVVGWSDPEALRLPAAGKSVPMSDATIPAKAAGSVRILSYNVLKNQPAKTPGPFSRLIQVIKPDIILFQEWDTDQATAQAWFTAVVSGEARWYAKTGEGGDVLIVSPYAIRPLTTGPIVAEGAQNPVRIASGVVSTPIGDIAVASVHLKCCGTVGSTEDKKRIAEATAVQTALSSAMGADAATIRIIGGDFNLVGSATPLETIGRALDVDGSSLSPAEALLIGDNAAITWYSDTEKFPPGRLDYILYSDASAATSGAFIFDSRRLSQKSLAALGVDVTDSAASDHLPVVVDIRRR